MPGQESEGQEGLGLGIGTWQKGDAGAGRSEREPGWWALGCHEVGRPWPGGAARCPGTGQKQRCVWAAVWPAPGGPL